MVSGRGSGMKHYLGSLMLLLLALTPIPAEALDPNIDVSQYAHAVWLVQDGYFNGTPWAVTQTTDGYIWVGTGSGLLRFDGSRFAPWKFSDAQRLPSDEIFSLLGARDGSLWIGTRAGLAHFVNRKLVNFPEFHDSVHSILEDPSGTIWISREGGSEPRGPICKVFGKTIQCLDKSNGVPLSTCCAGPLVRDRSGNLWAGTDRAIVRWRPGASAAYSLNIGASNGLEGVNALSAASDGSLWVGMEWTGRRGGLEQFAMDRWKPFTLPGFDGTALKTNALLLDRDGGLWVGTANRGVYHIHGGHVDRFGAEEGLSSNFVLGFFEDREGGVWVATSRGLDSFHQSQIITFSTHEGLSADNVVSVVVSQDDTVWLANGDSLDSVKDGRIASVRSGNGLPGHEVTSLFEDHAGHLWVGVDNDLFMYEHRQFYRVRRKNGSSTRFIVGITEDTAHNVWAEVSGSKRELIRIRDLKVVEEYPEALIPSARPLAADRRGGIWLGLRNGNLARLRSGHIEVFPFPHDTDSDVHQVMIASDGSVYGTTAFGLVARWNGKSQTLTSRNGLPCDGIIGVIQDNQGALWLYTECGLVEVEKAELQRWWADPLTMIASKRFGALDGVQPGIPDYNPIAKSSDGKLWFANQFVLQSIDPGHLIHNEIRPPVHLEDLFVDRKRFSPAENLRLPPLTLDLQIDYTALSFVNPRKVRFRYKLEGRDATWQDPGTRRQAFYNDLSPGKYRFQVIACNNDGVWNEQGATLGFSVLPAWYQTAWFRLLALTFGLGLALLLILFDRQRYATLLRARYDERLEVRTRLARELHDTLLQTIQGSKPAADVARESLSDPGKLRSTLDRLSQWLDRASSEGRAALESLRGSSTDTENLPVALRDVVDVCRPDSMQIVSSASGVARPMHPMIRDEVFRIGEEAIRNACAHSGGTSLTVGVDYGKNVTLTIRDDGCGFDPKLVDSGKPGHFGILGMRERASHIGGRLSLSTRVGEGSCLTLIIPGKVIFISPAARWLAGIFGSR